jgi:hypothetical protein
MANHIHTPGPTVILASSSTGPGSWFRVHPKISNLSFQATLTGSSVGVAITGSVKIEASADGTNALDTSVGTITPSVGTSPDADGFTTDAGWGWYRANLQSISTGSVSVVATASWRS